MNEINWHIENNNENDYLTLGRTDGYKDTLKNMKNYGKEIKDLIRSTSNIPDNYDEKYMKIKFQSDDNLFLKKHYNFLT